MADRTAPEGQPQTIAAALARTVELAPDTPAYIDPALSLTYAELDQATAAVARSLIAAGVQVGDTISIWAPNSTRWAVAALGIYRAGATLVTLNTRYKPGEAGFILDRGKVKWVFSVGEFLGTDYVQQLEATGRGDQFELIVDLEGEGHGAAIGWEDFISRGADISPAAQQEREWSLGYENISDVVFTSGTTGRPKGAMFKHGASVRAFLDYSARTDLRAGDRVLGIPPFFHGFGLKAGILGCLLYGATMVPMRTFDAREAARLIEEHQITYLPGPPTVHISLVNDPEINVSRLRSLRASASGSAKLSVDTFKRAVETLGLESLATGYGLSEATVYVSQNSHEAPWEAQMNTVGYPGEGIEVRIGDPDGKALPDGEAGEILVRGYNVTPGYFDDPAATQAAIDADGWLHTGDVGKIDPAGRLVMTDRIKDMYIVGGFNAYPTEVEGMMLEHESVAEVAVIGIPDDRLGEVGMAFVVARSGREIEPDALILWCRDQMANFKVPRRVQVLDELPHNASGKVLKYRLREMAAAG